MLKIGNLTIPSRCILSPLSGVSDLPFRMLNRSFGCEFAFLEMISAIALNMQRKKTNRKLNTCAADKPLGIQLLGNDLTVIQKTVSIILERYPFVDIIDLNAACPTHKVVNRGEGAGLLKDPPKLLRILKGITAVSSVPVTVKIRIGWDEKSINARDIALGAQDAGIKALFIHGRTRAQRYSGSVDYQTIREVKKALTRPVIASGDVLSAGLVKKMIEETGCDGVLLARGALGNPWIFKEITALFEHNAVIPRPTPAEVIRVTSQHLDAMIEFYGLKTGVMLFRKFFHWYARESRGMKKLRRYVCQAADREQMLELIHQLDNRWVTEAVPC